MTIIAVTGGGDFADDAFINRRLDELDKLLAIGTLLSGGSPTGTDHCAERWAIRHHKDLILFPANWGGRGVSAAPQRNRMMLNVLKAIDPRPLLIAFPGGDGTKDCVDYAHLVGIEVRSFAPKKGA